MIDGGIFLGIDPTSGIGSDVGGVLARMDRFGVAQALATSFRGIYFDAREGNAETSGLCAQSGDRLLPVATVNMLGYDAGADTLERIKADRFLAVALFPGFQNWSWSDYAASKFAAQAAAHGLPIQAGVWNRSDLAAVARNIAPAGGAVLVRWMRGSGYNNIPDMIAVALDYPNVVFDISTVTQSGGIEHLVERIGAERLYLASGLPLVLEGAPYFMLEAARLPDQSRRSIKTETLTRILNLAPTAQETEIPAQWERLRRAPKIDTHWHTSGWNIIEPRTSPGAIAADFDAFNYQVAISSSIRALNHDITEGNAETKAFVDTESRARGLVVVNPLDIETSISEIEKYRDDDRFVGIKTIQDFYGKELSDPAYLAIFEVVARMQDWPVMAHMPGMRQAAERFPSLHFIAAHSTWRYAEFAGLDNVWFDIATSTALRQEANLADLVASVGEERVVFSCDGQLMNPAWTLGKLASSGLPDRTLQRILGENAFAAFPRLRRTTEPLH
jgi:predicted TIM-barrel fold metal-dependent hydrolase